MLLINKSKFNHYVDLREELWEVLLNNGYSRKYGSSESLLVQNQPKRGMICVVNGKVKSSYVFKNGNEKILGIFEAPTIIGEDSILADQSNEYKNNQYSVLALTPVEAVFIPVLNAQKIILQYPEIALCLMKLLIHKMHSLGIQVGDLLTRNISQRTARALGFFTEFTEKDKDGYLSITHEELAGFIGITRPNVSTCLKEFALQGLIEMKRGKIKIINPQALKEFADY
ncbi:MAG: Crp/Fnr family transcriptional regulator [Desulfitobacteriia bacterium]|jgi:CRP/FNR family cyclic AMP-dependent transcriptional regulator